MADLPDIALDQLGLLFKSAINDLSLPLQVLVNLLCLLGKKTGGSRVIAIMCSFYRCLMKANGTAIREWDLEHGHRYDSALAGCSSLQAAVLRALKIENGNAGDMHCALMAWDMDKFYDSIDFEILAEELIERDFPPELLVLGMLAHQAPRILKVGDCISEPIVSTGNSIVAGCQASVSLVSNVEP